MADVQLVVTDEFKSKPKNDQSTALDAEVEAFSQYMANLGDWKAAGPLSKPEKALVKTFLIWKLKLGAE